MFKKLLFVLFFFTVGAAPASRAEDGAWDKLGRGVANVVTAPVEIVRQTRAYWIDGSKYTTHISFWLFSGLVKGLADTVKRAGSGVWDICTFPIEKPQGYRSLIQPPSVFEDWPKRDPRVTYVQYGDPIKPSVPVPK